MIIVSGWIEIKPGSRDAFLAASREAIVLARQAAGCSDFVVAADPIEPNRVNVYEEWASEAALLAFRESGPSDELSNLIVGASVRRHTVARSGPA